MSVLAIMLFAGSCSVDSEIRIHDDASGTATVVIRLHPVAVTYMRDISQSTGAGETTVFDQDAIRRGFDERPGVILREITQSDDDTLELEIEFDDVGRLFESTWKDGALLARSPVEFKTAPGGSTLTVALSRSNFGHISGLFVMPDSPLTVLLPYSKYDFMSKEEYLEVLEYAMEDYLTDLSVKDFINAGSIRVVFDADRDIERADGGVLVDGDAVFTVPALDVLTLEEDLTYDATW